MMRRPLHCVDAGRAIRGVLSVARRPRRLRRVRLFVTERDHDRYRYPNYFYPVPLHFARLHRRGKAREQKGKNLE